MNQQSNSLTFSDVASDAFSLLARIRDADPVVIRVRNGWIPAIANLSLSSGEQMLFFCADSHRRTRSFAKLDEAADFFASLKVEDFRILPAAPLRSQGE